MCANVKNNILLSTAYFPPVQYFSKFLQFERIYIEQFENFSKQTYRNRCEILGANGIIPLVVPVVKGRGKKIKIRDLQVSYDTNWQRNHWRTIFSAYNSSPFFEFYKDDIFPFFAKRYKYLFDLNQEILETFCELIELETPTFFTEDFEKIPENSLNFREALSPKRQKAIPDANFNPQKYTQVFSEKFGFVANLSILDLLFNEGPNCNNILEKSVS
jgi:hypothetical protein